MKFYSRINSTIINMKSSVKRFPLTLFMSTILAISLICLREGQFSSNSREILRRINMVLGLGIPLSLSIKLFIERFFRQNKSMLFLLQLLGTGFLALYYFVFLRNYEVVAMARYLVTMIFLILAFLYIPRLKNDNHYEYYIMDVYYSFALTFIYSLVLYLGIAAIFLTIDSLFDVNIKGEFYYYMFLIVSLVFAISLFSSKIPSIDEEFKNIEYTKALKMLILYIVIPLISIYTAILYVYFAKILITMEWPKGLVSHLVLWYSTISVGIVFLITPILEENKLAKVFKIWFPKVILPVLLMMFMSIGQRINQYGITENRYYLIVLGLWVTGIMLYFSLKKPLRNIIIPISLSIVMLNSVFGPLGSFAISKSSQNKRLEKILNNNNMMENGQIVPKDTVSVKDKREINNIITYFNTKHNLQDIKSFPKDIDINKIDNLTGFKYEQYYPHLEGQDRYFNYGSNDIEDIINIKGYDYYLKINSWDETKKDVDGLTLQYNKLKNMLIVSENDKIVWEQDITSFVKDIHEKQENINPKDEEKDMIKHEDMTYEVEIPNDNNNKIKLKFIFNSVYGKIINDDELIINSTHFILLIKR